MIALDTNYLISALVSGSPEAAALIAWHRNGEVLAAPSVVSCKLEHGRARLAGDAKV